jgi:histidinol dehydrogenase
MVKWFVETIFAAPMKIVRNPDRAEWAELTQRPVMNLQEIKAKVMPIMEAVGKDGDKALIDFTEKFDRTKINQIAVPAADLETANDEVPLKLRQAIDRAIKTITLFHEAQKRSPKYIETTKGVTCWRKAIAIEKVGLYIPGGTAPLFSTVLMLGIPAKIAGCKEIVLCSPSVDNKAIHPAILYTAHKIGIKKVFRVGGAQAIAAMTFGTESIPKVHKIFGPGNQYVTAAKQLALEYQTAIDMPAGPSEVAIFADNTAKPAFVAADLLSQAEHGVDSQTVLVTTDPKLSGLVQLELGRQVKELPREKIARKALENSVLVTFANKTEAIDFLNDYAAEHLIIATNQAESDAEKIFNAGSVFIGHYTPESMGDYASGTNHTLPTYGYAKMYSGVSLDSFTKMVTFQKVSKEGLLNLGPAVEVMAEAEELIGHKNAVTLRLKTLISSDNDL